MEWIALAGVAVIVVVLRDLFHALFHPTGRGTVSGITQRAVWGAFRRLPRRPGLLGLPGPTAVVTTIGLWFGLASLGWALVYWPFLPESFRFADGLDPGVAHLAHALYLSVVTQATLGFGDITPTAPWLQLVSALQAVAGFTILTASISWIMSIYPALGRQRATAGRATALLAVRPGATAHPHEATVFVLEALAAELARARADLVQHAVTYRFHTADRTLSLAAVLPGLYRYARELEADGPPAVRASASMLVSTLERLASTLADEFLHGDAGAPEALARFSRDHGFAPEDG